LTNRLRETVHRAIGILTFYFSTMPSAWIVLNPLLFIMFLPLGIHYVLTLPWPFLKDLPDPFGRGTTLYFLAHVYSALWRSPLWNTIGNLLILSGAFLFLWSFAYWLKSGGKLMEKAPYNAIRHPQYLGIITAVLGLSIQTARPAAFISWGIMTYAYISMAYLEEKPLQRKFGKEYMDYSKKTWFMLPFPKLLTRKIPTTETKTALAAATITLTIFILTIIYISPQHVVSLRGVTF